MSRQESIREIDRLIGIVRSLTDPPPQEQPAEDHNMNHDHDCDRWADDGGAHI